MFFVAAFWITLCALAAYIASQKGRSPFAWFLLSAALSPVVGLIGIIAVPSVAKPAPYSPPLEPREAKTLDEYLNS